MSSGDLDIGASVTSQKPAGDDASQSREAQLPGRDARRRSFRRLPAGAAAAALLAHGALLLAIMRLDSPAEVPEPLREIPVEVVKAEAAPEKKTPDLPNGNEKPTPERKTPPPEAGSRTERKTTPNRPPAAEPPPKAPDKARAESESRTETARDFARQIGTIGNPGSVGAFLPSPFGAGRESFRAVAVPLPDNSGGEAMNYSYIVGGMLKRMVHPPADALQRGAKGIATVGFVLHESGEVASVVLLRSSGDSDLDAESLAVVSRAAPFPPPPPGAQRSFVIEVAFGEDK